MNKIDGNIKKILVILLMIQLNISFLFSQNTFEIEFVYSPTLAKLSSERHSNRFGSSFGVIAKKGFESKFFISSGLYLRSLGSSFELIQDTQNPQFPQNPHLPLGFTFISKRGYITSSIDIPINIGYYFMKDKKIHLGAGVGLSNGFLLNQKAKSGQEIGIYEKYLLGATTNIEFGIKIKEIIYLNFRPGFLYQINNNNSPYKQTAIMFDIGVGYKL